MLISYRELFHETIADLRKKVNAGTKYELIRACGLCRHLLLDRTALIHKINRGHRLKITFEIADFSNDPMFHIRMQIGWITVQPNRLAPNKNVTLKQFLSRHLINYGPIDFNVRDLIRAASHYYGGIHSGDPEYNERYLSALNKKADTKEEITFMAIKAICNVVLKSMNDFEEKLNRHAPTGGF